MRLLKRLGVLGSLAAIVAALGVLTAGPVRADTFIGCPPAVGFDGNVQIQDEDCLIEGTVNGNIHMTNGSLFVSGTVNGNIVQAGVGSSTFPGSPNTSVTVGSTGIVIGHIRERP